MLKKDVSIIAYKKEIAKQEREEYNESVRKLKELIAFYKNPSNWNKNIKNTIRLFNFIDQIQDLSETQIKKKVDSLYNLFFKEKRRK